MRATSVRTRPSTVAVAAVIDVLCVTGFAAVGRASHDEAVFAGLVSTAWPFLVALVAGWLVTLAWRRPLAPAHTGLGVWVVTVAGGMLLRALTGAGTAPAFIVVATLTLGALLVGWRAIAALARRRRD